MTDEALLKRPLKRFIFGWEEERSDIHELTKAGEVIRLQTVFPDSQEVITQRVLAFDCGDYLKNSISDQIKKLEMPLENRLDLVRKSQEGLPIVVLPGASGSGTVDESWVLSMSGREVYYLSHLEAAQTDVSKTKIEQWRIGDYVKFYETVLRQVGIKECDALGWFAGATFLAVLASEWNIKVRRLVLHNPGGIIEQSPGKLLLGVFTEGPWLLSRTGRKLEALRHIREPLIPPPLDDEEETIIRRNKTEIIAGHNLLAVTEDS